MFCDCALDVGEVAWAVGFVPAVESDALGVAADLREDDDAPLAVAEVLVAELFELEVRLALLWSGVVPNWSFWVSIMMGGKRR